MRSREMSHIRIFSVYIKYGNVAISRFSGVYKVGDVAILTSSVPFISKRRNFSELIYVKSPRFPFSNDMTSEGSNSAGASVSALNIAANKKTTKRGNDK